MGYSAGPMQLSAVVKSSEGGSGAAGMVSLYNNLDAALTLPWEENWFWGVPGQIILLAAKTPRFSKKEISGSSLYQERRVSAA